MMPGQALKDAIAACGSEAELARHLGITGQAINQWKRAPANRVLAIEAATGGRITRHQLRPDLYPEEISGSHKPSKRRAAA